MLTSCNFKELREWTDALPHQTDGLAEIISETGEPYVSFCHGGLARKGDEAVIERFVAGQMHLMLDRYFRRPGRIYWRVRPDFNIWPQPQIIRYDDSGPDVDYQTSAEKRCVMDHNWVGIHAYCVVLKSDRPVLEKAS